MDKTGVKEHLIILRLVFFHNLALDGVLASASLAVCPSLHQEGVGGAIYQELQHLPTGEESGIKNASSNYLVVSQYALIT